ncbi:Uncharacterised protein [uncultured archaeon]|nr:Uncharacterised protein [uncultured archaeon]
MDNGKIIEIYNNLLDSLDDKRYLDLIWYKCITPNEFFDNYLKFYFFKKGMDEGYYPLTHFAHNKVNPKILEEWIVFKDDLNEVLPHKNDWPFEFLIDLCWLSKDGHTIPLCMELEQKPDIKEIRYDFQKLLFINSSLKIMVIFDYFAFPSLLELLSKTPFCNPDETFLLISIDKLPDQHHIIGYIDYHVRGCIFSKNRKVPDLRSVNFSIHITSQNCVEK